ncbi:MAG TPA: lysylphosphatidylglycerol synthase transmembrane domain-containing protein [Gemmataceae bacterium]|nr:lysylphosphatidylglycerol synthase transmembrane domain-containing protein [Gemmataceae bacterium]
MTTSNGSVSLSPGPDTPATAARPWAPLITLLKYGLGFGLLAVLIWNNWKPGNPDGLAALWNKYVVEGHPINGTALVLAFVVCVAAIVLTFVRWYVLVRAQELPFTLMSALRLGLIGNALNVLLPGSIGGDVAKAACIAREQSRRTVAVATVLIDRAIGLWALFWFVVILGSAFWALGWLHGETEATLHSIILGAAGLVAGTMLVWLLLGVLPKRRAERFAGRLEGIPKVGHSAAEFWRAVWMYRLKGRSIALALGLSLIGHVGFMFTFYLAARTIFPAEQVPTLVEHLLIVPIGGLAEASCPTPNGIGGGEAAYSGLYALMGKPGRNGGTACFVKRVIYWLPALVGYIVYLRMRSDMLAAEKECQAGESAAPALIPRSSPILPRPLSSDVRPPTSDL